MKHTIILSVAAALLFSACRYDKPLEANHTLAIDPALIGVWESVSEDGSGPDQRLLILKFSDTEYCIRQNEGKSGIYYRAYPIAPGGVSCIQLQVIGTNEGGLKTDKPFEAFEVMSYQIKGGELVARTLNGDLINTELKTTEKLQKAFLEHKGNANLFIDPKPFRRVGK
jgi:hypothetical protein